MSDETKDLQPTEMPETKPEETKVEEEAKTEEPVEASEQTEKRESFTIDREEASNEEAIKEKEDTDEPEESAMPSFFIDEEDRAKIEVDILFDKENGKLLSVSKSGLMDEEDFNTLGFTKEWFSFRPVDYEEMTRYRQQCTTFSRELGSQVVDKIAMRNYFIVWHLKDWSIRGRDGKKIELETTEKGALKDECIEMVYKCNTTMLDVVLTIFEKEMMM